MVFVIKLENISLNNCIRIKDRQGRIYQWAQGLCNRRRGGGVY